jgi:chromosomal replication initiator protein
MAHAALPLNRFVPTPESAAARAALQAILGGFHRHQTELSASLLVLHGPAGSGKTHLVTSLAQAVAERSNTQVSLRSASDLVEVLPIAAPRQFRNPDLVDQRADPVASWREETSAAALLILEDLQHLPARAVELVLHVLDTRQAEGRPTVVTALAGPRHLSLRGERAPARLTSRLAAGLVVALPPLQPASRLNVLGEIAQRRQLAVSPDILAWLAQRLVGGGRQLEGAILQLETLAKLQAEPLALDDIRPHFESQLAAARPGLDLIVQRVGERFAVAPPQLQSRRRTRSVVLPRQVSMYLARQLTRMSLQEIGAYFGAKDHSTVLHACRKIEAALDDDAVLSGTVRQLQMELT